MVSFVGCWDGLVGGCLDEVKEGDSGGFVYMYMLAILVVDEGDYGGFSFYRECVEKWYCLCLPIFCLRQCMHGAFLTIESY